MNTNRRLVKLSICGNFAVPSWSFHKKDLILADQTLLCYLCGPVLHLVGAVVAIAFLFQIHGYIADQLEVALLRGGHMYTRPSPLSGRTEGPSAYSESGLQRTFRCFSA